MPVETLVRHAVVDDLPAVETLRRADAKDLGFIPKARYELVAGKIAYEGRRRWLYEWLLIAVDNDDVTGFCFAAFHREGAKIEQVCVRRDARRMERALLLADAIEAEARRRHCPRLRCRVAADIEANLFWRAAGYVPVAETVSTWMNLRESNSRRPLIVYDKPLAQLALPVAS